RQTASRARPRREDQEGGRKRHHQPARGGALAGTRRATRKQRMLDAREGGRRDATVLGRRGGLTHRPGGSCTQVGAVHAPPPCVRAGLTFVGSKGAPCSRSSSVRSFFFARWTRARIVPSLSSSI